MKYYALDEEDIKGFLNESLWKTAGVELNKGGKKKGIKESIEDGKYGDEEEVVEDTETEEVVEEGVDEDHTCPLCESALESPISRELLEEFTNLVLEALNEATTLDEEDLEELTEEEIQELADDEEDLDEDEE